MIGVERLLQRLSDFALWVGAVAIVAMMVHVSADVLFKITINWPIAGTLEIVSFVYMVACIFLPLPHVQMSRSFIVVELFTQNLSSRSLLRLDMMLAPLSIFYLGILSVMALGRAWDKTRLGETQDATYFELPVWPMRWVFALACTLACLIAIYQMLDDIQRWRTGRGFNGQAGPRLGDHPV